MQDKALKELREELHGEYLNKYQLMTEFVTRKDNENQILRRKAELESEQRTRREWPVILAGAAVAATSVVSLIIQLTH